MKTKPTLSSIEGTWRFNDNVAENFDKHVNQSIPHYKDIQQYVTSLSEWFIKDNTLIYDLGCSTGETIKNICKLKVSTNFKIIGYDNSKKMISLAKKKLNLKKTSIKNGRIHINLKSLDVLRIKKFKKSNLFISILLFPFLNLLERKKLLKSIYKSLSSGGGFIFVEKIRSKNSHFEDILNQMYFDFKLRQKLTEKQILNKSKSLRSSMYLFDQNTTQNLLKECKFKNFEVFYKCFNFIGYIAIK